jgi:serine/threonine-protein kinase
MTTPDPLAPSSPDRDALDVAAREDLRDLFVLKELLPGGAASLVYVARDLEYSQTVAVKVMPRTPGDGPAAEEAFHRAAATAAVLDHPFIVPLYSAGATDRLFWYSMRYVEGRSLATELSADGPIDLPTCRRLVAQLASALDAAHGLGVVHAGLTPANVLVDTAGDVHITDFWVPWVLRQLRAPSGETPGPEADLRAVASLVPVCLGKTEAELPPHVAQAVARAASPVPAERFASVQEFAAALDPPPSGPPTGSQLSLLAPEAIGGHATDGARWRWLPSAVLTLVVLGAVAAPWLMSSGAPGDREDLRGDSAVRSLPPESPAPAAEVPRRDTVTVAAPPPPHPTPQRVAPSPPARSMRWAADPRPTSLPALPGRLFVNATPWGQVYVDGELVGNTPQVGVPVAPGPHRLRVARDGFEPFEVALRVTPGQELRFTDIVLREAAP